MKYIKNFKDVAIKDVLLVGGKNASLGQMINNLSSSGVRVPGGFAVTSDAYWYHIDHNNLRNDMYEILKKRKTTDSHEQLLETSKKIRALIESVQLPDDLSKEIITAYHQFGDSISVAVRSSATAEDLPTASFAGQQETFLNVQGENDLLIACKKSMSSLFTPRAIVYREVQDFSHFDVALSVGVQRMVRSDKASSGVAFSVDTESGFKDVVMIESSWGLGEVIVKGEVIPDLFVTHKPTIQKGYMSIIKKQLGQKIKKIIFAISGGDVQTVATTDEEQKNFSLSVEHIIELSRAVIAIEDHYSEKKGTWSPMDIEWAIDGDDNLLYIIQARPETVHGTQKNSVMHIYNLENQKKAYAQTIATGQSIGKQIVSGPVCVISDAAEIDIIKEGDILVTTMTDPDWVPAMRKASAIITERGGRTCHAAIVSRELSVAAIVGVNDALSIFSDGQIVTIDCSRGATGYVYDGEHAFLKKEIAIKSDISPPVDIMINIADPDRAFSLAHLPISGVGLARLEFIIAAHIGVHPRACLEFEKIKDVSIRDEITKRADGYNDLKFFFTEKLASGIAMIAAAFWPKPILVRLSDFKTNEYRNLLGGSYFEPEEENPMLGFRGASRYYHESYTDAFALECAAFKMVREKMGFENVHVMVPFVRTVNEAKQVAQLLHDNGLVRGKNNLEYVMMCEIPSNVILIEQFAQYFDGFSIGSNDLTQLILGIDRDSEIIAPLFDEQNEAVQIMISDAITGSKKQNKYIGICGQGPSDYPEFADFLIEQGISSISLNPDAVISYLKRFE